MGKIFSLFVLCFSLALFIACKSGNSAWIEPQTNYHIDVFTMGFQGDSPFEFRYDFSEKRTNIIDKIEVDFGEGNGYVDVTNDLFLYWNGVEEQPFHIYLHAGEYRFSFRFTFKNEGLTGTLVYQDAFGALLKIE